MNYTLVVGSYVLTRFNNCKLWNQYFHSADEDDMELEQKLREREKAQEALLQEIVTEVKF